MRNFIVCLFLVAACDTTSDHTKACKDTATAHCARLQACSPTDISRRYGTVDVCQTREQQVCLNSFKAPQNSNNDTRLEACAAFYPTQDCSAVIAGITSDACLPNAGPRANGQPCSFGGQCASTFCSVPTGAACGNCNDVPKAGDSCDTIGCGARGLECVNSICIAPGASGGSCTRDMPCGQGFSCVGSRGMTAGVCTAQLTTVGAACDSTRRMAADCSRDAGLYCDATTNLCVTVAAAADGAACGQVGGVVTQCQNGSVCFGSSGMTPGTCKAAAADGAACDSINGPACLAPARCVGMGVDGGATGTCQLAGSQSCG